MSMMGQVLGGDLPTSRDVSRKVSEKIGEKGDDIGDKKAEKMVKKEKAEKQTSFAGNAIAGENADGKAEKIAGYTSHWCGASDLTAEIFKNTMLIKKAYDPFAQFWTSKRAKSKKVWILLIALLSTFTGFVAGNSLAQGFLGCEADDTSTADCNMLMYLIFNCILGKAIEILSGRYILEICCFRDSGTTGWCGILWLPKWTLFTWGITLNALILSAVLRANEPIWEVPNMEPSDMALMFFLQLFIETYVLETVIILFMVSTYYSCCKGQKNANAIMKDVVNLDDLEDNLEGIGP
jgi:hypothetical protein